MRNKSFWKITPSITLGFLFTALLFGSCSYEPEGVFENGASSIITPSNITLTGLDFNEDSVLIYKSANFYPNLSKSDIRRIEVYRVIVDGKYLYDYLEYGHGFFLDAAVLTDGVHDLTLEIITNSKSKSIADKIGYEKLLMKKSWKLCVDRNYWKRSSKTIKDGYLKFLWPPYRGKNFLCYKLSRTSYPIYCLVGTTSLAEFTDSAYVGEGGTYDVEVVFKNGGSILWGKFNLPSEIPSIMLNHNVKNGLTVIWDKTPYYSAVGAYKIIKSRGTMKDTVAIVKDPNTTSTILNSSLFGEREDITLCLSPKNKRYYTIASAFNSTPCIGFIGSVFSPFKSIHYVNSRDLVYYKSVDYEYTINRYSTEQDQVMSSSNSRLYNAFRAEYTPDGSIAYFYSYSTQSVEIFNAATQESIKSIPFSSLPFSPSSATHLGGSNLLLSEWGKLVVYNTTENRTTSEYGVNGDLSRVYTSKENKFIVAKVDSTHILKYENGTLKRLFAFPKTEFNASWFEFSAVKDNELVVLDQIKKRLVIRNVADYSVVSEYDFPYYRLMNVDYFRNEILAYSAGHLYVVDLYTGVVKHDIATAIKVMDVYNNTFYLFNGKIFCSDGIMYYLN